jgi:hypothetical protein
MQTAVCAMHAGTEEVPLLPGYTRKLVCQWIDVPQDSMAPESDSLATAPGQLMQPDASEPAQLTGAAGANAQEQLPAAEQHTVDAGAASAIAAKKSAQPRLQLLPAACSQQLQPPPLEAVDVVPETIVPQALGTAASGSASRFTAAAGLSSSAPPAEDMGMPCDDAPAATIAQPARPDSRAAPQLQQHGACTVSAAVRVAEPASCVSPDISAPPQPAVDLVPSNSAGPAAPGADAQRDMLAPEQEAADVWVDEQLVLLHNKRRLLQQQQAEQQQLLQQAPAKAAAADQQHSFVDLQLTAPEHGPAPAGSAPNTVIHGLPGMDAYSSSSGRAATTSAADSAGPHGLVSYSIVSSAAAPMDGHLSRLSLHAADHSPQQRPVSQLVGDSGEALSHLQLRPIEPPTEGSRRSPVQRLRLGQAVQLLAASLAVSAGTSAAPGAAEPDEAAVPTPQQTAGALADAPTEADVPAAHHEASQCAGLGPAAVLPQAADGVQPYMPHAAASGDSSAPRIAPLLLAVTGGSNGVSEPAAPSSERLLRRAPCSEGAAHELDDDSGADAAFCLGTAPCDLSVAAMAAGLPCTEPLVADFFASGRPKRTPGGNLADVRFLCSLPCSITCQVLPCAAACPGCCAF